MFTWFESNLLIQIFSQDTFVNIFFASTPTASPCGLVDSRDPDEPDGMRTAPIGLVVAAFQRREAIVTG